MMAGLFGLRYYRRPMTHPRARTSAVFFASTLLLVRCGGSVVGEAPSKDDGGAFDASSHDVTSDDAPDTGADVVPFDAARHDAPVESSIVDAHDADALNCAGPATFDLPSQQVAEQICQPPSCKVCVQEVDGNSMPTKWSAWTVPPQCACPTPVVHVSDAGRDH